MTNDGVGAGDPTFGRALEVFAIIVLSLGTVGSAWSFLQATRWNDIQTDTINASNTARIESSKETTIATATIVYDATLLSQSAAALAEGRTDLQKFYREKLYRPPFIATVDQAVAEAGGDPAAVPNLFVNEAYLTGLLERPRQLEESARQLAEASARAGGTADDYVLVTVILAVTLFFAGTATSLGWVPLRVALLAIATLSLALGAARLASLPLA
jgi:hypothetical protein